MEQTTLKSFMVKKNEDQAFEVDNKDFKLHNLYYVYKYLCSSSLHAKSLAGNCDQYSL